jgi:hypothetical protein
VDHLGAVLDGNLDDLVAGEIGADRGVLPALANDVCLVGLCAPFVSACFSRTNPESSARGVANTLPVHRETVLIATQSASESASGRRGGSHLKTAMV